MKNNNNGGYHEEFIASASLDHQIIGKLSGFVEFFSNFTTENHAGWVGTVDTGLEYRVTKNIQLDCDCYFGVSRAAADYNPFCGITVEILKLDDRARSIFRSPRPKHTGASPPGTRLRLSRSSIDSVPVPNAKAGFWRQWLRFFGPAILISVGYMDPGNWGTDLAGGAQFKYGLLWVVAMASFMAVILQIISARLGMATGKDLAQCSRDFYPRWTRWPNWITMEIAVAATRSGRGAGQRGCPEPALPHPNWMGDSHHRV